MSWEFIRAEFYQLLSMYLPPWSVSVSHLHRYSKATEKLKKSRNNFEKNPLEGPGSCFMGVA